MRYRDTRGDDDLVGTIADDIFRVRRGYDSVNGGGGFDHLIVDYGGQTALGYAPDQISITETGVVRGTLWGGDHSSIDFDDVDRLTFIGSDARDLMSIVVAGSNGAQTLAIDTRGGADALSLYFVDGAPQSVAVDAAGVLTTAIGTFAGVERIAIYFGDDDDSASGGANADYLFGRAGKDRLAGGGGGDFLYAGPGADILTGGEGADLFHYHRMSDTRGRGIDTILDFSHADGDRIDLGNIDANPDFERNQAFAFIDQRPFSGPDGIGGEVRQQVNGDGTITLQGDVDHDGIADFAILIHTAAPLVAADIVL